MESNPHPPFYTTATTTSATTATTTSKRVIFTYFYLLQMELFLSVYKHETGIDTRDCSKRNIRTEKLVLIYGNNKAGALLLKCIFFLYCSAVITKISEHSDTCQQLLSNCEHEDKRSIPIHTASQRLVKAN
jgi:hypothetical protein